MYQLFISPFTGQVVSIKRIADSTFIPLNEDNTDYQAYLSWIAEGNTPLPADEEV
jgi:hypothetical protein